MINWSDNHDEEAIRFQTLWFEKVLLNVMKKHGLKPFEYRRAQ